MEPIITFVKENQAMAIVALVILVPLSIIYQKKSAPIIFHAIEYTVYLGVSHYVIYTVVKVIAWYKSQTPDINDAGAKPFTAPSNPLTDNFFVTESYNPGGVLYFEAVVALVLLYIVIVVRPASYSTSNAYKGDKERGMNTKGGKGSGRERYNRNKSSRAKDKK